MEINAYQHILVAVDFEQESEVVVARAAQLSRLLDARLTLLHVVEYIPPAVESMYLGYSGEIALPDTKDLEDELMEFSKSQMSQLGEQLGVPEADRLIRVGATGRTIDTVAAELEVDLVIVGSRGRHGLLGLFGDTAESVLRRATCDLLCVKIHEE